MIYANFGGNQQLEYLLENIAVIIVNWNGLSDTIECVESVLNQSYSNYTIYLIDNNSSNNEFERLKEKFPSIANIVYVKNETNLGFTIAHNSIFGYLADKGYKYIALLNNDAIAQPDWLERLVATAESENAGLVASLMINYYERSVIDNAGLFLLSSGEILPAASGKPDSSNKQTIVAPSGGACLYRTSVLTKIGVFDSLFSTGYEDAEFGLRAFIAGEKISYAPDAIVYHRIGRSVSKVFNRDKALKIQVDINYTYLKLMPLGVILINSLTNILRWIMVILLHLLTFRFKFVSIQLEALIKTIANMGTIIQERNKFNKLRKLRTISILKSQTFFLSYDFQRFVRLFIHKEKNQFEKY